LTIHKFRQLCAWCRCQLVSPSGELEQT